MSSAGASDRPVIEVAGLVVEYPAARGSSGGPVRAVDGLELEVRAGEVYAPLGENGAGKTSTIEVLEGLEPVRRRPGTGDICEPECAEPTGRGTDALAHQHRACSTASMDLPHGRHWGSPARRRG